MKRWKGEGIPKEILSAGNGADDESAEVILRVMAGKLKWWEAAQILGVTDRS
jgi:hypothetical protein